MPLTDINKVRSLIGDNNKIAVHEQVTENADGASRQFQLDMFPIRTGTMSLWISAVSKANFTGNYPLGLLDVTGGAAPVPTAGAQIVVDYQYNALSDDEIQMAIDLASGAGSLMAGAIAARSLAGNFSRFFAYTQGDRSIDKNMQCRKLLELAESLENAYKQNITLAGTTLGVATFDDSGTVWEEYDTALATLLTSTS